MSNTFGELINGSAVQTVVVGSKLILSKHAQLSFHEETLIVFKKICNAEVNLVLIVFYQMSPQSLKNCKASKKRNAQLNIHFHTAHHTPINDVSHFCSTNKK